MFSLLDWLGDIGGLFEIFFISFSLIISIYHYKTFEIYMVRKLYKKKAGFLKSADEKEPKL